MAQNNTRRGIRRLAATGLLAALCFILGVTPLGLIPIPPVQATLLHIPVIIAGIMVGPVAGSAVSLVFIAVSLSALPFMPGNAIQVLALICMLVIPRLLIGPAASWFRRLTSGWKRRAFSDGISAAGASAIHTAGFALSVWVFRDALGAMSGLEPIAVAGMYLTSAAINGGAECLLSFILIPAICAALRKEWPDFR